MFRPTASCIWNAFRSSGKRHLLLTGGRGSGKTTLFSALFPQPLPGITTRALPGTGVCLTENGTSRTVQIGLFDETLPGPENRMRPLTAGFADLGIPALERCYHTDSEWVSIDEIGYLESTNLPFQQAIRNLMEHKRLLAVIRKQEVPFLQELLQREEVFVIDLDAPYGNLGCVIMASGLGVRFGGNKLMADFHGRPLIQRALDATEGIFSRRVVVTRHEDVAALCRAQEIPVALHSLPHRSDTVRLGLEALGDAIDGCAFCPGDQPLLRRETVAALALAAAHDPQAIWRLAYQDTVGTPVLFPRQLFPELKNLPEGRGGGSLANKYPELVRTVPVRDAYELKDADSRDDLTVLLEQ